MSFDLYSMHCEVRYVITVLALPLGLEIYLPLSYLPLPLSRSVPFKYPLNHNPCVLVNLSFDLSLSVQMLGAECRKHQMDLPSPHSDSHWGE